MTTLKVNPVPFRGEFAGPVHRIPGVASLRYVDVVGEEATTERLGALRDLHQQFFPEYPHVHDEITEHASGPGPYPGVVVHQWLFLDRGRPVGFYLFDTNTRRAVVLRHFLALTEPAREGLPKLWLGPVTEALANVGSADCRAAGRGPLLASASEVPEHLRHRWAQLGSRQLPELDYAEPAHGMHWRRFGPEPEFLDITLNVRLTAAGEREPYPAVIDRVLRGYLLDHYRLPADNPRVQAILARAATLRAN